MKKYYFTCGKMHRHVIDGNKIWDKDSVVEVEAQSQEDAVNFIVMQFGYQWGRVCQDIFETIIYSKGIIVKSYVVLEQQPTVI